MKFMVLSRQNIKYIKPEVKHIVISISEDVESLPELPEISERLGTLRLIFHDIDIIRWKEDGDVDENELNKHYILFNENFARQILHFIDKYKSDIQLIICQCEAGISRSAGVAVALSKILNGDDKEIAKQHCLYNRHVYNTIMTSYHEKEKIGETMKIKVCKYCKEDTFYQDGICGRCSELLVRTRNIDIKLLNKILKDNSLIVSKIEKGEENGNT